MKTQHEQKDYRECYKKIVKSKSFKEAYHDKSLGSNEELEDLHEDMTTYERNMRAVNTLLNTLKEDLPNIKDRYGDDLPNMLDNLIWWSDNIIRNCYVERRPEQ